jgi:hypothetical protein
MESAGRVVRTGEWVAGSAAPGLGAIGVFVPAGVRRAMATYIVAAYIAGAAR